MLLGIALLLGVTSVVALVTAATVVLVRRMRGSDKLALALGGLFFPVFVLIVGSIDVFHDQEVDGPPPGMVLLGLLSMCALATPITFLVSFLLVRTGLAKR